MGPVSMRRGALSKRTISMLHLRSKSNIGSEQQPQTTMLGISIPRKAVTDKAGYVCGAILLYTVYPLVVHALISGAVYFDVKGTHGDKFSPAEYLAFLAVSGLHAIFHTLVCCLIYMAPSGCPGPIFLEYVSSHSSRFGYLAKGVMVMSGVFFPLHTGLMFYMNPFSNMVFSYCGPIVPLSFLYFLTLPLLVLPEFPISWEPIGKRWKVHCRRLLKSIFSWCLVMDPILTYPTLRWCYLVDKLLLFPMGASMALRTWFCLYMILYVPCDEIILWDLENLISISLPAWAVAGMAFWCAGPFNDATAPEGTCSADAWMMHGASVALGCFLAAFTALIANDITLLSSLSKYEEKEAAVIVANAFDSIVDTSSPDGASDQEGVGIQSLQSDRCSALAPPHSWWPEAIDTGESNASTIALT